MASPSQTARARATAEAQMTDTCRITRGGGPPVLNEETGNYDHGAPTVVYAGRCGFVQSSTLVSEVESAGQRVVLQQPRLDLPMLASAGVAGGDDVEMTASLTDPGIVGLKARVAAGFHQTTATKRRLPLEVAS